MWPHWRWLAALLACAAVDAQLSMFSTSFGMTMSMSGQGGCFNTQNGFTTLDARPLTYNLEPMRTFFEFVIPDYPGCTKVGVSVSACEVGGSSTLVQLAGQQRAYVTRSGDLSAPAALDTVVYCA